MSCVSTASGSSHEDTANRLQTEMTRSILKLKTVSKGWHRRTYVCRRLPTHDCLSAVTSCPSGMYVCLWEEQTTDGGCLFGAFVTSNRVYWSNLRKIPKAMKLFKKTSRLQEQAAYLSVPPACTAKPKTVVKRKSNLNTLTSYS